MLLNVPASMPGSLLFVADLVDESGLGLHLLVSNPKFHKPWNT